MPLSEFPQSWKTQPLNSLDELLTHSLVLGILAMRPKSLRNLTLELDFINRLRDSFQPTPDIEKIKKIIQQHQDYTNSLAKNGDAQGAIVAMLQFSQVVEEEFLKFKASVEKEKGSKKRGA